MNRIQHVKKFCTAEKEAIMLTEMGNNGYELCAKEGNAYYFKREIEVKNLAQPDVNGNEAIPENKQSGEVALLLVRDENFWDWVDLRYERFMKRWELNAQPEKGNWDTFELYEKYKKERQQQ